MTIRSAKAKISIPTDDSMRFWNRHVFVFCNSSSGLCECGLSREHGVHIQPEPEKRIVLMLNDYPAGVYTTEALAAAAAEADWKKREPRWKELGLTMGQSSREIYGGKAIPYAKWFYRTYEFVVDGEARL